MIKGFTSTGDDCPASAGTILSLHAPLAVQYALASKGRRRVDGGFLKTEISIHDPGKPHNVGIARINHPYF